MILEFLSKLLRLVRRGGGETKATVPPLAIPLLRYLIGASGVSALPGYITEPGWLAFKPKGGPSIAYLNLLDQSQSGKYGPYLPLSGTALQYNEPAPDPRKPGFEKNIRYQLDFAKRQGYDSVEWDNPDSYSTVDVLRALSLTQEYGLKVYAKNPLICKDPAAYVSHPTVIGIIVEKGAGTPKEYQSFLKQLSKDIPVYFVFHGNQKHIASEYARDLPENMFVSYSAKGEYGSSEQL